MCKAVLEQIVNTECCGHEKEDACYTFFANTKLKDASQPLEGTVGPINPKTLFKAS